MGSDCFGSSYLHTSTILRKLGDHKNNRFVVTGFFDKIQISRRPAKLDDGSHFEPCPQCKQWLLLNKFCFRNGLKYEM